jgi:acyl-CoA-binding protein
MEINNFEIIKTLLNFNNEDEFYFLQIIQRKKDRKNLELDIKYIGSNNHSRLIKAYYIYSIEDLDKYKPEIIALCEMFKARAGINLNKRSQKDVALEMLELLARDIRVGNYNCVSRIYNSICGQVKGKDKIWLIDIDTKDEEYIKLIKNDLVNVKPIGVEKMITIIPSKSGYHLITKPFDTKNFIERHSNLEIHKNNPTNLYIP